jgi:hypothetical protein
MQNMYCTRVMEFAMGIYFVPKKIKEAVLQSMVDKTN